MTTGSNQDLLVRIAAALERMAPPAPPKPDWSAAEAFVWEGFRTALKPVSHVARVPIGLLKGIDAQRDTLLANTRRFAIGLPANNALLWGARGTGKSALVKAVHEAVRAEGHHALKLVEIHRDEVATMGHLLAVLAGAPVQAILFCDDLSFDSGDSTYRALKTLLDGGIAGRPPNVMFYATSNRRHLMPQEMIENERASAVHPGEAIEERVSLSDRFGLWLGFHNITQQDYLAMVEAYARHFALDITQAELKRRAIEWSMTRGSRSGRVAWQFIEDLAGELGQRLAVSVTR